MEKQERTNKSLDEKKAEMLSKKPLWFWKFLFGDTGITDQERCFTNWESAYEFQKDEEELEKIYQSCCDFSSVIGEAVDLSISTQINLEKFDRIIQSSLPNDLVNAIIYKKSKVSSGALSFLAPLMDLARLAIRLVLLPHTFASKESEETALSRIIDVLSRREEKELMDSGRMTHISPIQNIESYRFIQFG